MTSSTRLVMLLVLLFIAGAAAFVSLRSRDVVAIPEPHSPDDALTRKDPNVLDAAIGHEPSDPPVFAVEADFNMVGEKPLLTFNVTEKHGWAADAVMVEYWHIVQDENGEWYQLDDPQQFFCRGVLKFGGVLTDSTPVHYTEFTQLDEYGTSENWRARVVQWGKVLAPRID